MSIRVDSASFSATGICVGGTGLGVKGSVIRATTATGTHGPGLLYDDWDDASDDDKELRAFITGWPAGATLFVHEDGSFDLTAPDGSYTITYRLDEDGVSQGTTSETVNVGVLTAQADFAATRALLAAVQQDFTGSRDLLSASAVQQDFAASRAILAAAQSDYSATRGLLGAVQGDFAAARTVLAAVQQDFASTRPVFSAVEAVYAAARAVLAAVQQDYSGAREIEATGQVTADFSAARQILQVVQADYSATREVEAPLSVQADFVAARFIAQIVYMDFTASRLIASEALIAPSCYAEWATVELEVSIA